MENPTARFLRMATLAFLFLAPVFWAACTGEGTSGSGEQGQAQRRVISACLGDPACNTLLTVGHRGVAFSLPENTAPAYEHALSNGADIVETDVRTSADGTFVVFHDSTVDRITDGTGKVAEMTVAELKGLSIPADDLSLNSIDSLTIRYRPLFQAPGLQKILTLEELLDWIPNKGILYIDFKAGDLVDLAARIRDRGLQDHVYIAARSLEQAQTLASIPGTAVMADPPQMDQLPAFLDLDPVLVELTLEEATPEVVEQIHQAGVKIMMNALGNMDMILRFRVLLALDRIQPIPFLCTFLGELIPEGILRVQDGTFDPIDADDLESVEEMIDRVYSRLVDAGADVIQTDFLDLLTPFAQRANQARTDREG